MTAEAPAIAAPTPLWRRLFNHRSFMFGLALFGDVGAGAAIAEEPALVVEDHDLAGFSFEDEGNHFRQ